MAVRTEILGSINAGAVTYGFDWDDANGDVVAVRVHNTSGQPVFLRVEGLGNGPAGRVREGTFQSNPDVQVISIPGGQRPRYPVVVTDGVPGVGGYLYHARWPA